MSTLKTFIVYFKSLICIVLLRSYGNIIYDLAQKYEGKVSLSDFRAYEKLTTKRRKADLDVNFMKDCQSFNVFPNFVCFPLPNVNHQDVNAIRRRLLRSAINKRSKEQRKLNNELLKKTDELKNILNSVDWYIFQKSLNRNVDKRINSQYEKQRAKLQKLTKNRSLPFTHQEIVTNLSSHNFKPDELELLKNGLNYAIKPTHLNQTEVLSSFENIHLAIKRNLKNQDDYTQIKNELLHMAQSYISSYRPTKSDIKKYRILQRIKRNKDIILLKPDKSNGVVILDRQVYKDSCMNIIKNVSKFKLLTNDPTLAREAQLQRFLRKLKKIQALDNKTYYSIFPRKDHNRLNFMGYLSYINIANHINLHLLDPSFRQSKHIIIIWQNTYAP